MTLTPLAMRAGLLHTRAMGPTSQDVLAKTVAVIPAYNEAQSIALVLGKLAEHGIVNAVVGIDHNNTDNTPAILAALNVPYIVAPRSGYDSAVSCVLGAVQAHFPQSEYVLFSDAGNKYDYGVIDRFAEALARGADMVLGDRVNAKEHMRWHQRLGTWLVLVPINLYFKTTLHDLGPIRMARRSLFAKLGMQPRMFRWPTESLIKALAIGATIAEVPMTLMPRIGTSKVSGNLKRSLQAGLEMYSAFKFFRYTIPGHVRDTQS